jgi:hypothetical protein
MLSATKEEVRYLRELARKYQEYANLPVMAARKELWYKHNSLRSDRPIVVVELGTFLSDILPALKCESPAARELEGYFVTAITNHELVDDDKVIAPYVGVSWEIGCDLCGLDTKYTHAEDAKGRNIGFAMAYPIEDIERDICKLKPPRFEVNREATPAKKAFFEEIIGDILPVTIKNTTFPWFGILTYRMVNLMGMETMFIAMKDQPDAFHRFMTHLSESMKAFLRWQESEKLICLNNGYEDAGGGSYGFTHELPRADRKNADLYLSCDMWAGLNSQESVGVSPAMFGEFIYPYYHELAKEIGLVYYGCCEPVHEFWDDCLSKLPNLRKVSISPWCDEAFMGERLAGGSVIYSRKPFPNFLGVDTTFNAEGLEQHLAKTVKAARGGTLEIIFRDTYTLMGEKDRPGKAVKIARGLFDKLWKK